MKNKTDESSQSFPELSFEFSRLGFHKSERIESVEGDYISLSDSCNYTFYPKVYSREGSTGADMEKRVFSRQTS